MKKILSCISLQIVILSIAMELLPSHFMFNIPILFPLSMVISISPSEFAIKHSHWIPLILFTFHHWNTTQLPTFPSNLPPLV